MPKYVLSVHCGHDASATLLRDGEIAVAIAQERLDRVKHSNASERRGDDSGDAEAGFPWDAVNYCLDTEGIGADEMDLYTTSLDADGPQLGRHRVSYPKHHLCHAASVFYTAPTVRCAVLVMDYAGETEWVDGTGFLGYERESAWLGDENGLSAVWRHLGVNEANLFGIGCVYNEMATYLFGPGDAEGKLMALAAYGRPNKELGESFFVLRDGQVYVRPSRLFSEVERRPAWLPGNIPHYECALDWDSLPPSPKLTGKITQFHKDLAYRLQKDVEDAIVYMARQLRRVTGAKDLGLAGGVALNCAANMRVALEAGFERVFVPPAAGDSGQSMGAAFLAWHQVGGKRRVSPSDGYTGRAYSEQAIEAALRSAGREFHVCRSDDIAREVARLLVDGRIVAWFQGRSEFGPRALGARSILADPRRPEVTQRLNEEVKRRRWFQPVAPSVRAERCPEYFDIRESPYMCFAAPVTALGRAAVPGVVHADGTARVHTVTQASNPLFYRLLTEFESRTGVPIVANTSFNPKGDPIVESPEQALDAMTRMPVDILAIGPYLASRMTWEHM